jgi:Cu+-exporting ATPase
MNMNKITLPITGMHCAGCVQNVEKSLKNTSGVISAAVNLATEKAIVEFDPQKVQKADLIKAVQHAGYGVRMETQKITLKIGGMHCASCVGNVERFLADTPGVLEVKVNLATEKALVEFDPALAKLDDLKRAVENSGYQFVGFEEDQQSEAEADRDVKKVRDAKIRMAVAWAFTIPLMLWMAVGMAQGHHWPTPFIHNLVMVVLALPVLLWPGWETFRSAWNAVTHKHANMDVLIALGTTASILTGLLAFFMPVLSFAGIAAMIMAFHLTGRYIETKARGRASEAIKKLLQLGAKTARVIRDGRELDLPIESVQVGDVMVIRPGEKIPTDGKVVEGDSLVDESLATGESMPVQKQPGSEVIGATINQHGLMKVQATRVGKDTFLAQMIRMVEEVQSSKVPIQQFADRVTAIFVPAIVALATVTFLAWLIFPEALRTAPQWAQTFLPWVQPDVSPFTLAIFAFVAVLVIACPCALGLATPTALMVGSGMGAEHGILIRDGAAIQKLKDVKVIVFDKTGTLTKGRPAVTDVIPLNGFPASEVLQFAASLEAASEHPLGKAIVDSAKVSNLTLSEVSDFRALPGKGVAGTVRGKHVLVGTTALLDEFNVHADSAEAQITAIKSEAKTAMLTAIDTQVAGVIAVADELKVEAADTIKEIEKMGYETAMITGDNRHTAEAIATKVGIKHVLAEVLPHQKVAEIKRLQNEVGGVAMVGDGINDAPALTQADVGIAIGTGTDIAIESADITLVRGNLDSVVEAIKLSRATFRKIKQNLFWAFFYNVVAIPLAVLGLLHPVIAEIAMASSSVTVVTNANLLKRISLKSKP